MDKANKIGFIRLGKLGPPYVLAIESFGYKVCGYDIDFNIEVEDDDDRR